MAAPGKEPTGRNPEVKIKKNSKRRNGFVKKLRPSARINPLVQAKSWVAGRLVDDAS